MIKIIDNRGMVFGKINIIDLLVVIFILCLTPMLWYGYKLFKAPKGLPPPPSINWEQKYEEEIAKQEKVFKEHPRFRRYFK